MLCNSRLVMQQRAAVGGHLILHSDCLHFLRKTAFLLLIMSGVLCWTKSSLHRLGLSGRHWAMWSIATSRYPLRLLFFSFVKHWYKVAVFSVQTVQRSPNLHLHLDALQFVWKALKCYKFGVHIQANTICCCFVDRDKMLKSSPAWRRNARDASASASRAARSGQRITDSQCLRILDHHLARMLRTLAKCGTEIALLKRANCTKCYCRTRESGKALDGWVVLSDALCQVLQATLLCLEEAKQNASVAPQAVSALEESIQQVKFAIYRCDPLHVQISKIETAIGRAENTVKYRRVQLWRVLVQRVSVVGRGSAGLAAGGVQVMYLTYLAKVLCVCCCAAALVHGCMRK